MVNRVMGVPPAELADDDLVREVDHLHETRGDALRGGTESALRNHTVRLLALEEEFLRRFPEDAAPDPARTRAGRRAGSPRPEEACVLAAAVIGCADPHGLARFWSAVLGNRSVRTWTDARGAEYVQLEGIVGHELPLVFQPISTGHRAGSTHLDVVPRPGRSQQDEVRRLVDVGATVRVDEPDLPWVVMADPEGNEFCVLPR